MDSTDYIFIELYAAAYQQLASISAVLGGLAFTAAAALLAMGTGSNDPAALNRSAKITVATAVGSSVLLIIAALFWSFMSADLGRTNTPAEMLLVNNIVALNWIPSLILIAGAGLFFISLGASGWIASQRLGLLTSCSAVLGIVALGLMVRQFG